jgi:hypothetical protein
MINAVRAAGCYWKSLRLPGDLQCNGVAWQQTWLMCITCSHCIHATTMIIARSSGSMKQVTASVGLVMMQHHAQCSQAVVMSWDWVGGGINRAQMMRASLDWGDDARNAIVAEQMWD